MTSLPADAPSLRRNPVVDLHPIDALAVAIIYGSTFYFAPHALMALGAGLLVLRNGIKFQQRDIIVAVFIIGSLANMLIHSGSTGFDGRLSNLAVPLILVTVLTGRVMPPGGMRLLVLLTCVEVFVGLYEFSSGRIALTASQVAQGYSEFASDSSILYQKRVYGLSGNSSEFAQKIFLSIMLVFYTGIVGRLRVALLAILIVGLYITFNRTAIFSTIICLGGLFAIWASRDARRMPIMIGAVIVMSVVVFKALEPILLQITRGYGSISYSEIGRLQYLNAAVADLSENPWLGNGSFSWRVFDPFYGVAQHAHNSLAMIFVENGIILAAAMLLFIALGWRKQNTVYILSMIAFSMSQYLFFWNISLADIVLHRLTNGEKQPPPGRSE